MSAVLAATGEGTHVVNQEAPCTHMVLQLYPRSPSGDSVPGTFSLISHSTKVAGDKPFDRTLEWVLNCQISNSLFSVEARVPGWCFYLQGEVEMAAGRCAWLFLGRAEREVPR